MIHPYLEILLNIYINKCMVHRIKMISCIKVFVHHRIHCPSIARNVLQYARLVEVLQKVPIQSTAYSS